MTELVWVEYWPTLEAKRTYRLRVSRDYDVCLDDVRQLQQIGKISLKDKEIQDWDEFFDELEPFSTQPSIISYEWKHQTIEAKWFEALIEAGTETIQSSLRIVDLKSPAYELITLA